MKKFISRLFLLAGLAFLTACSTLDHSAPPTVSSKAQWVVLPFSNHTETPLAAGRAEAIAESLLRANGIGKLRRYPASLQQEALFETGERKPFEASLEWARKEGARYALTGSRRGWRTCGRHRPLHHRRRQRRNAMERSRRKERLEPRSALGRRAAVDAPTDPVRIVRTTGLIASTAENS